MRFDTFAQEDKKLTGDLSHYLINRRTKCRALETNIDSLMIFENLENANTSFNHSLDLTYDIGKGEDSRGIDCLHC